MRRSSAGAPIIYNQIINLFWTLTCFLPVLQFWLKYYNPATLFTALGISLLPLLIPTSYYRLLQISKNRKFYEAIGIKTIQAFTQNGSMINNYIRKKYPDYTLIRNRRDLRNYKFRIAVYEKYHVTCFIFFIATFCLALLEKEFLISVLIIFANIVYNIIPLLIQQYNKLRTGVWLSNRADGALSK